jgi:hypothetical protein
MKEGLKNVKRQQVHLFTALAQAEALSYRAFNDGLEITP